MTELKMIDINLLVPHPENPRKEIGDISELADSIKSNGIMQNLTVVPYTSNGEELYRVIIGHRRLAAAKTVGIKQLPCIVSDMGETEQLATMLAENMQRVDLTIPEQAFGIQMMFDFGSTTEEVQKLTGLSKKTIKDRKAMTSLGKATLQKAYEKGATLDEYAKLGKVESDSDKEKLLTYIGTANFNWAYENVMKNEKRQKLRRELESRFSNSEHKKLSDFPDLDEYATVIEIYMYRLEADKEIELPELKPDERYAYYINDYSFCLYRLRSDEEKANRLSIKAEEDREEQIRHEKVLRLDSTAKLCEEMRRKFITENDFENAKNFSKILEFYLKNRDFKWILIPSHENIAKYLGIKHDCVSARIKSKPTQVLLAIVALTIKDNSSEYCHDRYTGVFRKNDKLCDYYEFLISIGYELSDAEKEYITTGKEHQC